MKARRYKGITLVEMIVTILIGFIVMMGTATVLTAGHNAWNQAWRKTSLQREAYTAMLYISSVTMAANAAETENDGAAIKIYSNSAWTKFYFDAETKDILREIEGKEPHVIINGKADSILFKLDGNKIETDLILKEGDSQVRLVKTVMMRNYGE